MENLYINKKEETVDSRFRYTEVNWGKLKQTFVNLCKFRKTKVRSQTKEIAAYL